MPQAIKLLALAGVVALLSACAGQQEEFVIIDPEPISVEPTFTGKYK